MKRTVQRFDVLRIDKVHRAPEGYLDVDLIATRVGVFDYGDHKELRPEGEVFKADSLATLDKLPVTNNHPFELLDSTTAKQHAVGFQTEAARRDGKFIATKIRILDEDTVKDAEAGKIEISMGYTTLLEFAEGEFEGEHFDAVQRDIRYNHIAIVDRGRAGAQVRLKLDSAYNQVPEEDSMIKFKFDGTEYEVKDQATADSLLKILKAQKADKDAADEKVEKADKDLEALKKTKGDAAEMLETVSKANDRADKAEKARDEAKGLADAAAKKTDELEDPKRMDAAINARIVLLDTAKSVGLKDDDVKDKTDREVKVAIITAVDKDTKIDKDTSDGYLDGQLAFIGKGMEKRTDAAANTGKNILDALQSRSPEGDEGVKTDEAKTKRDEREKARASQPMGLSKQKVAASK